MRIGIVTVQDSNNFGSFLQAYAMQTVLEKMGHEVVFIRTRSKKYIKRIFYRVRPDKRELLHPVRFMVTNWRGWRKYKRFQLEQKCFQVIENYKAEALDLVILGSDEIWNVQTATFRHPIFYGEGMEAVMAYAVSIGNAEIEDMQCIPESWLLGIKPILVRDMHTKDYLKTIKIKSTVVCDPTLLIDKSAFWRGYKSPLLNGQPFLLVYSYGLDQEYIKIICSFAEKRRMKVFSACFSFDWCDGVFDCTALDFCEVMKHASFVFSSTYHGTIFSILNHKQFVSLPQSRKTKELLEVLGLSDKLVKEGMTESELKAKMETTIDYLNVDRKIERMREDSLKLLREGIEYYVK